MQARKRGQMYIEKNLQSLAHDLQLCRCQAMYGSDKGYIHSYLQNFYQPLLQDFMCPNSILEIGIYKGSSMVLWRTALPNSHLTGIDIQDHKNLNPEFKVLKDAGVFALHYGDAYTSEKIYSELGKYDLVIDDGPHTYDSQIMAIKFRNLLSQDGILVIEDVPNMDYRLRSIRRSLPKEDRKNLSGVGFTHLTGRHDDALIVYCSDPKFREWKKTNLSWISRNSFIQTYVISILPISRFFFRLVSRRTRRINHKV